MDRTTLRAHVAGHGGVVRRRVGAGAPLLLPDSAERQLADWLVQTAVAKRCPTEHQVLQGVWYLAVQPRSCAGLATC